MVADARQYDDPEENLRAAAELGVEWTPGRHPNRHEHHRRYRARRRGEIEPFRHVDRAVLERNAERRPNGCLIWGRAVNSAGYGHFWNGDRMEYAHRAALETKLGRPLKPGMKARHTCDVRLCIEQTHLVEGTHRQNMADMIGRGRAAWQKRSEAPSSIEASLLEPGPGDPF